MKYVDGVLKFDRVYRSIGVSAMVLDYFEDAWSFPSPRFRAGCLPPNCATLRAVPISSITASGKANRSSLLDPVQNSGFSPGTLFGLVM
jgi:hypothetical protein